MYNISKYLQYILTKYNLFIKNFLPFLIKIYYIKLMVWFAVDGNHSK